MSPKKNPSQSLVALLRGINVGGKHRLLMKELAELFADAQCSDVRTYIQSGNVVFKAPPRVVKGLAECIASNIERRYGFASPVILRTAEEMAQAVRDNPFLPDGAPEKAFYVYFLAGVPQASAVQSLDPGRSAPDAFQVVGHQVYLHLPHGMGRTKLTNAYFDSKLSTISTARNWATVLTLLEMMRA